MGPFPPNLINIAKKISGQALIGFVEAAENSFLTEHYEMKPDSLRNDDGGRVVHCFATNLASAPGLTAPYIFKKVSGQALITGMGECDEKSGVGFTAEVDPIAEYPREHVKGDIIGNTIGDQKHRGGIT